MLNVISIIKKYNIHPSKRLGQNFLIDQNIVEKITSCIDLSGKEVIEVGPGIGAITYSLSKVSKKLDVYEIDKRMVEILEKELISDNLTIHLEDFMKTELNWDNKKIVFGNIPYYITSKIIFKIFRNSNKFEKMVIMLQKDVADKMMSKINTKKYGKLSLTCEFFGGVNRIADVSPSCFYPSPKVESTIIMIDLNNKKVIDDEIGFIDFIKKCFTFRRKTIFNNLKLIFNSNKILKILKKMNIESTARPQTLSLNQFMELWRDLNDK